MEIQMTINETLARAGCDPCAQYIDGKTAQLGAGHVPTRAAPGRGGKRVLASRKRYARDEIWSGASQLSVRGNANPRREAQ